VIFNPLSAKKDQPKWKWLCASARLTFPYNFSISYTCAGTCFHVEYTQHPALTGL